MARRGLTEKQQLFVQEYLIDLNATRAYQRAYGCSIKVADANGPRLLGNARIAKAIQDEKKKRAERLQVDQDDVVRLITRSAITNMRRYASWDQTGVTWTNSDDLEEWEAGEVQEISQEERFLPDGTRVVKMKLKLTDKLKARDMLGKHFGIYKDDLSEAVKELGVGLSALIENRNANSRSTRNK